MKNINLILVATISIMAIALNACNKDITLQENEQESAGTIMVSVDGLMGEYVQGNDTKSGLVSTTRVSWSTNDKVYVYDGISCLGELTVSLKDGKDYYAVLTGENITAPQSGTTKLTLVHSNAFSSAPAISNGKVSLDLSRQEGDTTPKDIPFVAYAALDYTPGTTEISGQIADFSLATSLMRLNCTGLEASTAISGATLKSVSYECVLNITKEGASIDQGNMGNINISFTGVSASSKGAQTLYAAVAQNANASRQGLIITQTGKSTYTFGSKAREAGKAINAICQMGRGCLPGMFTVNNEAKKVLFSLGNMWVDATVPDAPVFSFETHQYDCQSNWSASHFGLYYWSKYIKEAIKENYNDEEDSSNDDVLFTNLTAESANPDFIANGENGKYRTLSINEWKYLLDNRTVNGGTGKGKSYSLNITYGTNTGLVLYPDDYNGAALIPSIQYTDENFPMDCVFLPTAGIRRGSDINNVGISGGYFSSSAHDDEYAYNMIFGSENVSFGEVAHAWGMAIRLVTDVK